MTSTIVSLQAMLSASLQSSVEECHKWLAAQPAGFTSHGLSRHEVDLIRQPICMWRVNTGWPKNGHPTNFDEEYIRNILQEILATWDQKSAPTLPEYQHPTNYTVRVGQLIADVIPNNRRKVDKLTSKDWVFSDNEEYYCKGSPVFAIVAAYFVPHLPDMVLVDGSGRILSKSSVILEPGGAHMIWDVATQTDYARADVSKANNKKALSLYAQAKIFESRASAESFVMWMRQYQDSSATDFTIDPEWLEASTKDFVPVSPTFMAKMQTLLAKLNELVGVRT